MNIETLASLATALLALGAALQIGLAIAAMVLLGAIRVVLAAVSVIDRGPVSSSVLTVALWCMAAFFALNTLANALGRHPLERWGEAPSRRF